MDTDKFAFWFNVILIASILIAVTIALVIP